MMSASSPRQARAALSRLFEPSDLVGMALVQAVGAVDALRLATAEISVSASVQQQVTDVLAESGLTGRRALIAESLDRWRPRVPDLSPQRDLETIRRLGGTLLIPGDDLWPSALEDLQLNAPIGLWARGNPNAGLPALERTVAIVGSRDSTHYGASVTGDIAGELAGTGYTVMSGGAYGIDAHAHRAALAAGRAEESIPTVAVMACGLDRFYPAGNEDLLRAVCEQGILLAEVPPGVSPTRWRFLQRNRIIAAMSAATVVVEARWRSGALNTANHAASLGRALGAVPGPVHSANSAGCHRLLREAAAICVTDASEVKELCGPMGSQPESTDVKQDKTAPPADHDGLCVEDLLLLDALPVRGLTTRDKLAKVSGLSLQSVRVGLARLELAGLASRSQNDEWRKNRGTNRK